MVRLGTPGVDHDPHAPTEVVGRSLPSIAWDADVAKDLDRFHALVIGPGLGRADLTVEATRRLVAKATIPVVVDGDGLFALAWSRDAAATLLAARRGPTVLTPHDGEFTMLSGARPGADRLDAARGLAADTGAVVLLKGPATVIAGPDGRVLVSTTGDPRLATAGTGDVLTGIIGALLAQRVPAFEAAAAAAWLHGRAAAHGVSRGLIAGDLPDLLPAAFAEIDR
jgi:NAD(P)H-hydrate epimerase